MNILIVNGPNLNLLGKRNPEIYGYDTLGDIMEWLEGEPEVKEHSLRWFQSNHEGEIIDLLHREMSWADGIIINPGAFTHYSYAILDALYSIETPTVEVHLSDLDSREEFRKISVIKPACVGQVKGLGKESYLEGLRILVSHLHH